MICLDGLWAYEEKFVPLSLGLQEFYIAEILKIRRFMLKNIFDFTDDDETLY